MIEIEKKRLRMVRKLQRKYNKLAEASAQGKLLLDIEIEKKVKEKLKRMGMKRKQKSTC